MGLFDRLRRTLKPRSEAEEREAFRALLQERDEGVYASAFGPPLHGSIATLSPALLRSLFRDDFAEQWLRDGVYVYEPSDARPHWTYVTAGLSTPWTLASIDDLPRDPASVPSGVGHELVLRTPAFSDWAIRALSRLLAYEHGVATDRLPGALLKAGERIPLKPMGVAPSDSAIGGLAVTTPDDGPTSFVMRSGRVELLLLVGITAEEYGWSCEHGTEALVAALRAEGKLVTDLARATLPAMRGATLPPQLVKHFA